MTSTTVAPLTADARTPCVMGCRAPDGRPHPAQPGYLTCYPCAAELRSALSEIVELYALVDDAMVPGSIEGGGRAAPGFGPRSPARDGVLALTDPRTRWTEDGDLHSVLEVLTSWADNVRHDTGLVPADLTNAERNDGRLLTGWLDWTAQQRWATGVLDKLTELHHAVATTLGMAARTVSGEANFLIRWLDWITRQYWVADLGYEVRQVRDQLRTALGVQERSVLVGTCPAPVRDEDGEHPCGAGLRARLGGERITCRSCGTSWPRERWDELRDALGTPLSDTASLSVWLSVPTGTLRRWRSEDQWTNHGTKSRPLYARTEVLASWQRRRGPVRAA
ncbi:hypothetical protein ACQPW3_13380 [Actinosynnema sp. CA-248983]